MKKHSYYKWFSRLALLSGIPMMFGCAKLYGPPPPDNVVGDEVLIQGEKDDPVTTMGEFQLNDAPSLP